MSVYVDMLIDYGWKLGPSCHMLGDTEEELHAFALGIGLKRAWFQESKGSMPHYDLTVNKRILAVKMGAIEIDRRQLIERLKKYKNEATTTGHSKTDAGADALPD